MKHLRLAWLLLMAGASAPATTLDYLSLEELISRATVIVRGKVVACEGFLKGPGVNTRCAVQVLEQWKGPETERLEVIVPGGVASGRRQSVPGAPALQVESEYVFFLWTSSSGETQLLGLSQGLFVLDRDESGQEQAVQAVPADAALERSTGRLVTDRPLRLRLAELRSRTRAITPARRGTQ